MHEAESLSNQMSKDRNQEKKINHTKRIWKNKGENIKNINQRGQTKIFNWRFKLNWKISLTKEKINKKNEGQIRKKKTKTLIENEIESQKSFNKRGKEKIKNNKNKDLNEKQNICEIVIEGLNLKKKQIFYKRNNNELRN